MMTVVVCAVTVGILGPPREVSTAASASRDQPALGLVVAPHRVLSGGGELSFFSLASGDLTLRLGFYGMLDLESEGTLDKLFPYPQADIRFWRGLIGYTAALSFDAAARNLLGEGSALEAEIGYHHESEHYTGSNEGDAGTDYHDVPQIGDAIQVDLAARLRPGDIDVSARVRERLFIPERSSYRHAPGIDLELRWRASPPVHVVASIFAERLFGAYRFPDAYLVRGLAGIALPSVAGDLYIYLFADVGNRKGLAALTRESNLGFGFRVAWGR